MAREHKEREARVSNIPGSTTNNTGADTHANLPDLYDTPHVNRLTAELHGGTEYPRGKKRREVSHLDKMGEREPRLKRYPTDENGYFIKAHLRDH